MTKSKKIDILQADHVVGLSKASIEINIGIEILLLGGRALCEILSWTNSRESALIITPRIKCTPLYCTEPHE